MLKSGWSPEETEPFDHFFFRSSGVPVRGPAASAARPRSERSGRSAKSGSGQGSFQNEAVEAEAG